MAFAVAVVKGHGLQPTLQGAIDCGIVLRKGTYPVVDRQSGCVEPVCDETPEIWRDVVRDLIEVYREVAETMKVKLYSVLLRGSVPKGIAAVDGTSDLDSLAYFVSDQPKNAEKAFRHWKQHRGREAIERCEQKHNIARRIGTKSAPAFLPSSTFVPLKVCSSPSVSCAKHLRGTSCLLFSVLPREYRGTGSLCLGERRRPR